MAETTLYPIGYGTRLVTMDELRERHSPHIEPEYADRGFAWLEWKGGTHGIGGGYRYVQPIKPGFAPPGLSFHQDQEFADGFIGYCAWDLVVRNPGRIHRAPRWDEVPEQDVDLEEIATWGVQANVNGSLREPWHLQPMEIDGHSSWVRAGRPRPTPGLVFPGRFPPAPPPKPLPPQEPPDMKIQPIHEELTADHFFTGSGDLLDPHAIAVDSGVIVIRHPSFAGCSHVFLNLGISAPTSNGWLTMRGDDGDWDEGLTAPVRWLAGERETGGDFFPVTESGDIRIGSKGEPGTFRLAGHASIGYVRVDEAA